MKRSLLDPLPRPLSTPALVALVALVVCGTGVAVARFLEMAPGAGPGRRGSVQAAPEGAATHRGRESGRDALRPTRPSTLRALSAVGGSPGDASGGSGPKSGQPACDAPRPAAATEPTLARPPSEDT